MATYSFMEFTGTLNGPNGQNADIGYGAALAEEGVTVTMAEDKNTMVVGADGEVMHSLHAANHGTVTVKLLKTSPINAKLDQIYNTQKTTPRQWGLNTITLGNKGNSDSVTCSVVAFKKCPDWKNAKDGDIVEWVFDAGKIQMTRGAFDGQVN